MEPHKIKQTIDKYFDGQTSLQEEKELKKYFSSDNIDTEFLPYKNMFKYFSSEKTIQSEKKIVLQRKYNTKKWFSMVASVVVLLSIGFFMQQTEDLGTFDDPEIAFIETQKALYLIAENINKGKEKTYILQEYQNTKNTIFIN